MPGVLTMFTPPPPACLECGTPAKKRRARGSRGTLHSMSRAGRFVFLLVATFSLLLAVAIAIAWRRSAQFDFRWSWAAHGARSTVFVRDGTVMLRQPPALSSNPSLQSSARAIRNEDVEWHVWVDHDDSG